MLYGDVILNIQKKQHLISFLKAFLFKVCAMDIFLIRLKELGSGQVKIFSETGLFFTQKYHMASETLNIVHELSEIIVWYL